MGRVQSSVSEISRATTLVALCTVLFVFLLVPARRSHAEVEPYLSLGHRSYSALAWAPDGQRLAIAGDGEVKLWDVASQGVIWTFVLDTWPTISGLTGLAFSADGTVIAVAGLQGVSLCSSVSGETLRELSPDLKMDLVAISADGRVVAGASRFGTSAALWSAETGALLQSIEAREEDLTDIALSQDGALLATASQDGMVRLWSVATGKQLFEQTGGGVSFSPDGATLATFSTSDDSIRLWSTATGEALAALQHESVNDVTFSEDGDTLTTVSSEVILRWSVSSGQLQESWPVHADGQWFRLAPGGALLAVGCDHGSRDDICLRSLTALDQTGDEARILRARSIWTGDLSITEDERQLIEVGTGAIHVRSLEDGRGLRTHPRPSGLGYEGVVSPSGQFFAGWDEEGAELLVYSVATGERLRALSGDRSSSRQQARAAGGSAAVAFSPDGRVLASGLASGIRLWSTETWRPLRTLKGPKHGVASVGFSPDGRLLAAWSTWDVELWSLETGRLLRTLEGGEGFARRAVFSPDGALLATVNGRDGFRIRLWSVDRGEALRVLEGHEDEVWNVAFSPDGATLASASWDGTVRLWSVADGRPLRTLRGHSGSVFSVAFTPDSRAVFSASADGTTRLWRVADGALVATLAHSDEAWVAFTPQGDYTASRPDTELLRFREGQETWPSGELQERFFHSELPLRAPALAQLGAVEQAADLPPPWLRFLGLGAAAPEPGSKTIKPASADRPPAGRYDAWAIAAADGELGLLTCQGLDPVEVRPLGSAEARDAGVPEALTQAWRARFQVGLLPGKNDIACLLQDQWGRTARDRQAVEAGPAPIPREPVAVPDRWLVVAATNTARDMGPNLPLRGAELDGERIARWARGVGVPEDHIHLLSGEQAFTRTAFYAAMHDVFERSKPGDLVLVHLSSHGLPHPERPGDVLIMTGETEIATPAAGSLSGRDIVELVAAHALQRRVLLAVDTCLASRLMLSDLAGKAVAMRAEATQERRDYETHARDLLQTVPETGVSLFMATGPNSAALEMEHSREGWQEGLFTAALLSGLAGGANRADHNGRDEHLITLDELSEHVRAEVQRRSRGHQTPFCVVGDGQEKVPLALVE